MWVGKQLIGWIVVGVIQYATGRSPSEWVSAMLGALEFWVENQIADAIYVTKSGGFVSAVMNNGCVWSGPKKGGTWLCPYSVAYER